MKAEEKERFCAMLECFETEKTAAALRELLPQAKISTGPWFVAAELTDEEDPYVAVMFDPALLLVLLRKFADATE